MSSGKKSASARDRLSPELLELANAFREDLVASEERQALALEKAIKESEDRVIKALGQTEKRLHDEIDKVGGHLAIQIDKAATVAGGARSAAIDCANDLLRVKSDTEALTTRFMPKGENSRRLGELEREQADSKKRYEHLTGRVDDHAHQLAQVQSRGKRRS